MVFWRTSRINHSCFGHRRKQTERVRTAYFNTWGSSFWNKNLSTDNEPHSIHNDIWEQVSVTITSRLLIFTWSDSGPIHSSNINGVIPYCWSMESQIHSISSNNTDSYGSDRDRLLYGLDLSVHSYQPQYTIELVLHSSVEEWTHTKRVIEL